ncbi:hypothetical protein F2P81_019003 [Scophthalmus maximus]|uniref:Uncharacterized protein n=1 Tax=Scophthalmus maximus TaxID=52904 RepID=A0A6A4SC71_SCOMX|nr:hypothetical protein F2P81_019003 [Scophthalmus maximus]
MVPFADRIAPRFRATRLPVACRADVVRGGVRENVFVRVSTSANSRSPRPPPQLQSRDPAPPDTHNGLRLVRGACVGCPSAVTFLQRALAGCPRKQSGLHAHTERLIHANITEF